MAQQMIVSVACTRVSVTVELMLSGQSATSAV